ncbi:MAG: hypothetical protein JO073_08920 [Actinobacteria bacterium]|nr:hypothetical protein [Actinomycetota bacterium]
MRRLRASAAALAVAAAGVGAALLVAAPAQAFPRICSGTACHGSATDSIPAADVCVAGTTKYWEDSYLPSNAVDPQLTSFQITPSPPCTGATVSQPTVEGWPASATDPDGGKAAPKPGEATFRVTWTVTVPSGSTAVGAMAIAWSIAWTEPAASGGSTTPKTTTAEAGGELYDLDAKIATPLVLTKPKGSQQFTVRISVVNNGPAPSLIVYHSNDLLEFLFAPGEPFLATRIPEGCSGKSAFGCVIPPLKPHAEKTFTFVFTWTQALRAKALHDGADHVQVYWSVNEEDCAKEETTCANNGESDQIAIR